MQRLVTHKVAGTFNPYSKILYKVAARPEWEDIITSTESYWPLIKSWSEKLKGKLLIKVKPTTPDPKGRTCKLYFAFGKGDAVMLSICCI